MTAFDKTIMKKHNSENIYYSARLDVLRTVECGFYYDENSVASDGYTLLYKRDIIKSSPYGTNEGSTVTFEYERIPDMKKRWEKALENK